MIDEKVFVLIKKEFYLLYVLCLYLFNYDVYCDQFNFCRLRLYFLLK